MQNYMKIKYFQLVSEKNIEFVDRSPGLPTTQIMITSNGEAIWKYDSTILILPYYFSKTICIISNI